MSLQNKPNVYDPLSDQPCIVGSKRNLAVRCANLQCSKELLYLREGRLELLELESHSDNQTGPDDGAFAMNFLPSKLFWLCGECAKTHVVKRWTTFGPCPGPSQPECAWQRPRSGSSSSHRCPRLLNDLVRSGWPWHGSPLCTAWDGSHYFSFLLMSQSMSEWMFRAILVILYRCSLATSQTISQIARSE